MKAAAGERVLLYGIGNPGRQDDGLGVEVIDALRGKSLLGFVDFEANYQLNVEDALLISQYNVVVFVDASLEQEIQGPYQIQAVTPSNEISFSTHEMSVGGVLGLCQQLYARNPRTFLVAVKGYEWGLQEGLTDGARRNCDQTVVEVARFFSE
ncbi:hydrogenase maturation protease [Bdellovibrionota bacterium FG-2]